VAPAGFAKLLLDSPTAAAPTAVKWLLLPAMLVAAVRGPSAAATAAAGCVGSADDSCELCGADCWGGAAVSLLTLQEHPNTTFRDNMHDLTRRVTSKPYQTCHEASIMA
jgi:hypothetical protein